MLEQSHRVQAGRGCVCVCVCARARTEKNIQNYRPSPACLIGDYVKISLKEHFPSGNDADLFIFIYIYLFIYLFISLFI